MNRIERRFYYSFAKLAKYNPPFVKNSEMEISKLLGMDNLDRLGRNTLSVHNEYIKESRKQEASRARMDHLLPYLKASDYFMPLSIYAGIHTAISFEYGFRGLKGKNILEIGANWGPYMHYLRHEHGANTYGVDTNQIAVEYARNGGLNFIPGDVSKMDFFQDNVFDIVVSRNFFDLAYRYLFLNEDATSCMEKIIKEVHRVMKPRGYFFSHEGYAETPIPSSIFSKCNSMETPIYQPVVILQK